MSLRITMEPSLDMAGRNLRVVMINFFIKNTEVYLASFFVSPDFRGHSVYPSLLQYFIKQFDHSESIKIAIEKQNGPSIRGAEKVGFLFTKQVNLWRACKLTIPKYTI